MQATAYRPCDRCRSNRYLSVQATHLTCNRCALRIHAPVGQPQRYDCSPRAAAHAIGEILCQPAPYNYYIIRYRLRIYHHGRQSLGGVFHIFCRQTGGSGAEFYCAKNYRCHTNETTDFLDKIIADFPGLEITPLRRYLNSLSAPNPMPPP